MCSLFLLMVKIAHALLSDFTKGDTAETKSQPVHLFLPAVCVVSIDRRWKSCGLCWFLHVTPHEQGQLPGLPELLHGNLGKGLTLNILCFVPCTAFKWQETAYRNSLDTQLIKMGHAEISGSVKISECGLERQASSSSTGWVGDFFSDVSKHETVRASVLTADGGISPFPKSWVIIFPQPFWGMTGKENCIYLGNTMGFLKHEELLFIYTGRRLSLSR